MPKSKTLNSKDIEIEAYAANEPTDVVDEPELPPSPQEIELAAALTIANELAELDPFSRARILNWVKAFCEDVPFICWGEN